jgi:hypothetical protein
MSVDEGYIGIPTAEFRTDADGNGLFEALIVRVPIVINVSGLFYLNAWLNNTGAGNSTDRTFSPGTYLIDFALPGYRLRISRTDGPYDLTIVLYDPSTGFYASRAYRTAAYRWDTFQFLAELQGGLSEVAVDANGDGLYNYLDVRGLLNVTRPENYTLRGTLYPKGSSFAVGFAFNRTHWSPGLSQFSCDSPQNPSPHTGSTVPTRSRFNSKTNTSTSGRPRPSIPPRMRPPNSITSPS